MRNALALLGNWPEATLTPFIQGVPTKTVLGSLKQKTPRDQQQGQSGKYGHEPRWERVGSALVPLGQVEVKPPTPGGGGGRTDPQSQAVGSGLQWERCPAAACSCRLLSCSFPFEVMGIFASMHTKLR